MYCFICKKYTNKQNSIELLRKHICLDCYNKYGNTNIDNQLKCSNCGYINFDTNIVKEYNINGENKVLCESCFNIIKELENEDNSNFIKFLNKELSPCNFSVVKNKPIQNVQEYCDQISECSNRSKPIKPEIFYWLYKKYNKDLKTLSRMFKVTIHTLEKWMNIYKGDNR